MGAWLCDSENVFNWWLASDRVYLIRDMIYPCRGLGGGGGVGGEAGGEGMWEGEGGGGDLVCNVNLKGMICAAIPHLSTSPLSSIPQPVTASNPSPLFCTHFTPTPSIPPFPSLYLSYRSPSSTLLYAPTPLLFHYSTFHLINPSTASLIHSHTRTWHLSYYHKH